MLAIGLAWTVAAADPGSIEIVTTNDLSAGNPFDDDRYTASFRIAWSAGDRQVTFAEHMFTDRDVGRRFDETWLLVSGALPGGGRNGVRLAAGAVRVGRGLFGERVQNAIHDAIGSERVALAYDDGAGVHAAVGATWTRRIVRGGRLLTFVKADAGYAPGFRGHAEWTLDSTAALGRGWLMSMTAGVRASTADHDLLAPHVRRFGTTWQLDVLYRGLVRVGWSHNRLGVGQRHVHVAFRLPTPGRGR